MYTLFETVLFYCFIILYFINIIIILLLFISFDFVVKDVHNNDKVFFFFLFQLCKNYIIKKNLIFAIVIYIKIYVYIKILNCYYLSISICYNRSCLF